MDLEKKKQEKEGKNPRQLELLSIHNKSSKKSKVKKALLFIGSGDGSHN